jgi:hypothetical protein
MGDAIQAEVVSSVGNNHAFFRGTEKLPHLLSAIRPARHAACGPGNGVLNIWSVVSILFLRYSTLVVHSTYHAWHVPHVYPHVLVLAVQRG